ncbi:MAG TPA: flagellar hook-associated protein FlgK [Epulopiscium sp.]|nr:flagellar hook-associated protein FlgK [Candidatus Epulonipiscium sp.]
MGSAFFEFNIGAYGLFAAQHGLSATSNNITNANTVGYSRQVVQQEAGKALRGMGVGMLGAGVTVTGIERMRNSYLDMKIWNQKPILGEYRVKAEQSSLIEGVFGEPSDVGFTTIFNDLFTGLDNLAKLPDEGERKFGLMQSLKGFTQYFNTTSSSLKKYQNDLNFEVKNKVDEINIIGRRIESLNQQIFGAEIHGGNMANGLRDERELQIDRLAELVNIEAKEYEIIGEHGQLEKRYSVKINGQNFVDHFSMRELDIKIREEKENPEDVENLYDVVWKDGLRFKMNDANLRGELKGAIDMRDGNAGDFAYRGIPYYIKRLDDFVQTFAGKMNGVYEKGVDVEGNDGQMLFSFDISGNADAQEDLQQLIDAKLASADPDADEEAITKEVTDAFYKDNLINYLTADNFRISQDILDDVSSIRTTTDKDKLPGGNDLLLELIGQKHDRKMFNEGEPNDYMVSIFSELGINAKEAKMYKSSQENMTTAIENQRLSVSQVDQSEEMISLVKYQQAYQAAARIISTMDTIYDITINRMGAS